MLASCLSQEGLFSAAFNPWGRPTDALRFSASSASGDAALLALTGAGYSPGGHVRGERADRAGGVRQRQPRTVGQDGGAPRSERRAARNRRRTRGRQRGARPRRDQGAVRERGGRMGPAAN